MATPYDVLRAHLSERVIAFSPMLARVLGGVHECLFFSQLAYWTGKGDDPEWVYKTRQEMTEETTLNRYQQDQARAALKALGVLEEERRGLPAKMHYRIIWPRVFTLLEAAQEASQQAGAPSATKFADVRQTDGSGSAEQIAQGQQSLNVETTTETTQETERRPKTIDELIAEQDELDRLDADLKRRRQVLRERFG